MITSRWYFMSGHISHGDFGASSLEKRQGAPAVTLATLRLNVAVKCLTFTTSFHMYRCNKTLILTVTDTWRLYLDATF